MRNQPSGPAPVLLGILVTLLCLALAGGGVYFGFLLIPSEAEAAIPQNLPSSLEQVKTACADGSCVQACIMQAALTVGYEQYADIMDSDYESELVSYRVEGDQLLDPTYPPIASKLVVYQRSSKAHHRIWDYFTSLIPAQHRLGLGEFVIYSGGDSGAQFSTADGGGWVLHVNVLDATDPEFLTHALVHEYGHFLTLNPSQQDPGGDEQDCKQEPLYGCPAAGSYVNHFFQDYWAGLYGEWVGMKGATNHDQLASRFYERHGDQFVSEYASSSPLEDITETWTAFILQPKPSGDTIADRKVLSLYQYPELVELRYEIITALCRYGSHE
jgi:hypothetical protein